MSQKQAIVCSHSKCGRSFTQPIELTTIQTDGSLETYDACPHCFSRVNLKNSRIEKTETILDKLRKTPSEAPPNAPKKGLKEKVKDIEKIKPAGCANFLGHLKTRPKGSPIPEECLTCVSVMQCMGLSCQP